MSERRCKDCRWFLRYTSQEIGECRRYPPQHPQTQMLWPLVNQGASCGEWADKNITPEQAEQRELAARFAVAIVQGCYANPEADQVNFVTESQRLARDFFEAQAEEQT